MNIHEKMQATINEINKKYGTGAIVKASDVPSIERISTGSISLDILCGIDSKGKGGIPKGRIVILSGTYSSGKSTIAKKIIENVQKVDKHKYSHVILSESDYDKDWDSLLGLDLSRVYLDRPENINPAIDNAVALAKQGLLNVLVIDSVSAGATGNMLGRSQDDGQQVGGDAQGWNMAIRKFHSILNTRVPELDENGNIGKSFKENDMIIVLISQERLTPGRMFAMKTRPGGLGKEHAASITIEFTSTEDLNVSLQTGELVEGGRTKDGEIVNVGERLSFKVAKNKTAGTAKDRGSFLFYTKYWKDMKPGNIDNYEEFLRYGLMIGLIERSGAWYNFNGEKFQGQQKVIDFLKTQYKKEELYGLIIPKVIEFFLQKGTENEPSKEEEPEARTEDSESVKGKKAVK